MQGYTKLLTQCRAGQQKSITYFQPSSSSSNQPQSLPKQVDDEPQSAISLACFQAELELDSLSRTEPENLTLQASTPSAAGP